MKILFYSTRDFERPYLTDSNNNVYQVQFTGKALSPDTVEEARGFDAISVFTNDNASAEVIEKLHSLGVKYITARSAGYDNIDVAKAAILSMRVANVPEYSPYAIAEHALALMLALSRKLILANTQVHMQNFTVNSLIGFDLHGKTIGIIGTGRIGGTLAKILSGFGCRILGYDIHENKKLTLQYGVEYVPLPVLCREAEIISIHTSLSPGTKYMIDRKLLSLTQQGVMLINTSRGGCVNTEDVLHYLENGHIGYFGADVYEKERGVFLYDWSGKEIKDELLKKLMAMPNVLITPHQGFATKEALNNIAQTTFHNIHSWANNQPSENELRPDEGQ
jgi:D-lactate dehydrogenase